MDKQFLIDLALFIAVTIGSLIIVSLPSRKKGKN
jgi:hypothetical protein